MASGRRALIRWSWRLFRREWRQQGLVLALLALAVGGTVVGLGVVTNATTALDPSFGTASTVLTLPGSDPTLASDLPRLRAAVGPNEVIEDQHFAIPGSVGTGELRAEDPAGQFGSSLLGLVSGHYPVGGSQVAVTTGIARDFNLAVGSNWRVAGRVLTVVGIVENPLDLTDQFGLVAPGQATPPDSIRVLSNAGRSVIENLHANMLGIELRGTERGAKRALAMLVLSTVALLFVGLLAAAGFMVMAQRRLRALGMLAAIGATDRQVRAVMVADGAVVGAVAAIVGAGTGLATWFVFAPDLASIAAHRVSRLNLPWWAVGVTMALAFATATLAAWWPAHGTTRIPVVAALAGRPPPPRPAHRFALAGAAVLAIGLIGLRFGHPDHTLYTIVGIVGSALGMLLLAPLATGLLARPAARAPVPLRLALRDLGRYQARSGAAAAAISLAVGVAAMIAVVANLSSVGSKTTPNVASNELIVYLSPDGGGGGLVPTESSAQLQTAHASVAQIAAAVHGRALELDEAVDVNQPVFTPGVGAAGGKGAAAIVRLMGAGSKHVGWSLEGVLFVATPSVLSHYGITTVDPGANVLISHPYADGQLASGRPDDRTVLPLRSQTVALPRQSSTPNALITESAMHALHLTALPAEWLVTSPTPLTPAQIQAARGAAAAVGLAIETQNHRASLARLRTDATAAGVLVALGVLAMTVGLIRSEAAGERRTLVASGASPVFRRTVTGATAGALALVGASLGVAGAYAALAAWYHDQLSSLGHVPFANLAVIIIGLPVLGTAGSWLLAGREPAALGRSPLD